MEGIIVLASLAVLVLLIYLLYLVAKWFFEVAEEKGYHDKKYFWICFWMIGIGIPLVIALPDRGNQNKVVPDELPDL